MITGTIDYWPTPSYVSSAKTPKNVSTGEQSKGSIALHLLCEKWMVQQSTSSGTLVSIRVKGPGETEFIGYYVSILLPADKLISLKTVTVEPPN